MKSAGTVTRRSLFGLAALAVAGCKRGSTASAPRLDPDASALAVARADEGSILQAYDRGIAAAPPSVATRLAAERAEHAAHFAALAGSTASASASPPASTRSLLRNSAASLREAALAATDGAHAALLASIAASHEVMLVE